MILGKMSLSYAKLEQPAHGRHLLIDLSLFNTNAVTESPLNASTAFLG